jgi:hypothetical protein
MPMPAVTSDTYGSWYSSSAPSFSSSSIRRSEGELRASFTSFLNAAPSTRIFESRRLLSTLLSASATLETT